MFENVLVVYNEKLSKKHLMTVENIKNLLEGRNISLVKSSELKESFFTNIDLVIAIGGDGTFIRAARFIKNDLILGVNSEPEYSEGALTSINENELDTLKEILSGKYKVIERQRLRITKNGLPLKELALNEVYVGASFQFHTSRYKIKLKEQEEEHRSSGVLIVTGSGSTAWYKSAGGKPFGFGEEKMAFLVREPYSGERVFKPQILKGEIKKGEKIIFESKKDHGGVGVIDSNTAHDFNKGDLFEIELAENPLKVIIK